MEWHSINVVFLYEKLKLLIGSMRLNDKVGQLLKIQLSWLQLFAGVSIPILEHAMEILYLPIGWIINVHRHLVENNIQVVVRSVWKPTIQRTEDRVIMDVVRSHTPDWAWEGINRCRLYLKANTIADISTVDGKYVPAKVRMVQAPLRNSRLKFPLQRKAHRADISQREYFIDSIKPRTSPCTVRKLDKTPRSTV